MKEHFDNWIIYEDDDYIGINKPAGISSLHERIADGTSVLELARESNPKLQVCHRIDKDTSGVLLLAKNTKAYAHLASQFESRTVQKIYHAVTEGGNNILQRDINFPLHISRSGRSTVNYQKGKEAFTSIRSLEVFRHFTLMEAKPFTGRLHQIRAHLSAIGMPIAGDMIYGAHWPLLSQIKKDFSQNKKGKEPPMIRRFALHAHALEFLGINRQGVSIHAEYAKDMKVLLRQLRKYDYRS